MDATLAFDQLVAQRLVARQLEAQAERLRARAQGARFARLGYRRGGGGRR